MENRHQLENLNFFSGFDGHSRGPQSHPAQDWGRTWNCVTMQHSKSIHMQLPKRKWTKPPATAFLFSRSNNIGEQRFERQTQLLLAYCFDPFTPSRSAERPFAGLISIYKYVTELKVSTLQNEVVWMSGEMGLQKIHSNFVSRQFTFGPVMIWVFLLMGEI